MGKATQIYRNGTILTMDSRGSVVSALAVEGNVVLAVGTDDDGHLPAPRAKGCLATFPGLRRKPPTPRARVFAKPRTAPLPTRQAVPAGRGSD